MKKILSMMLRGIKEWLSPKKHTVADDLREVFDEYHKCRDLVENLSHIDDENSVMTVFGYANEFRLELMQMIPFAVNDAERTHLNAMFKDASDWINMMITEYRCCVVGVDEDERRRLNAYIRKRMMINGGAY